MAKILILFDVDEDVLKDVSEQDDLTDAIKSEVGWVADSGMHMLDWIKVDAVNETVRKDNLVWIDKIRKDMI